MKHLRLLTACAALSLQSGNLRGDSLDPESWPRTYQLQEAEIAIYMPQILEWQGYRHLKANAAIGVKLKGSENATFGAVMIDADTVTDFDEDRVRLGKRSFTGFRFPELDEASAKKTESLIRSVLSPESPLELPLESVTTALERAEGSGGETAVSFDPPPIFFSESPAVLVTFIGQPRFEAVAADPSLMFAVNTNWDVLFDGSKYYLLAGNRWLVTDDVLKGKWTTAPSLPASFETLPDDENWSEVKSKLFVLPESSSSPRVFSSDRPAEIVVTEGKAQLAPISKTSLMYVANTESDLFFHPAGKTWYLLLAGRWFSSASLDGPWISATDALPDDFASIPENHPKASVLVSVKNSPAADEAVILASIPQTATVQRSGTRILVSYEGAPQFKAIPGAPGVEFALNTSSDVFRVGGVYFCCHQGVWFQSADATGPWIVCDKVPDAIYTIPPQSPKYNVTHVHIYESDADTVHVGVTSGYHGAYVARGLVVFGLGMWLGHEMAENDCWHHHYRPVPIWYGYGCGAAYIPGRGYYRGGAVHYGPYGGAGFAAGYNPVTGRYSRAAYAYGPYRSAGVRTAYNPWTNTAAGRVSVSTPYGSWGRSVVMRDDEWIRAAHRSTPTKTIAGVETSRGGGVVGIDRKYGSDGFVGKTADGDVYIGRDGNVYRRNDDGEWQKRENGGWQDAPDVKPRDRKPETLPARRNGTTQEPKEKPTLKREPVDPPKRKDEPVNRREPVNPPKTKEAPTPRREPANPPKTREEPTVRREPLNRESRERVNRDTPSQLRRDSDSRQRSISPQGGGRQRRR